MNFFDLEFSAEELLNGQVFCFDKPLGWTSFQVVSKVRRQLKKKSGLKKLKVGHAGTLDPLATGLLIICTGKKTKTISSIQNQEKGYEGIITLGATTPSYDLETSFDQKFEYMNLSSHEIKTCTTTFKGEIEQFPPIFSAIKKEGKRLYEYAREGKKVNIASRKVHIYEFEITKILLPKLYFKVRCSKGTYIRSLAHDFGKALNSGAYLSELRRVRIGNYEVVNAFRMEQ